MFPTTTKTGWMRRTLMATAFVTAGVLTVGGAATPAKAQYYGGYYPPYYAYPAYTYYPAYYPYYGYGYGYPYARIGFGWGWRGGWGGGWRGGWHHR
jgi:hypothetical protein